MKFTTLSAFSVLLCVGAASASGVNLALNKNSHQRGQFRAHAPSLANDGILACSTSFATTGEVLRPYWYVDLGAEYLVARIDFWRRDGSCSLCLTRTDGLAVGVSTSAPNTARSVVVENILKQYDHLPIGAHETIFTHQMARYVVLQVLTQTNFMSMCEVEVYEGEYFNMSRVWHFGIEPIPDESLAQMYGDACLELGGERWIRPDNTGVLIQKNSSMTRNIVINGTGFTCNPTCDVSQSRVMTVNAEEMRTIVDQKKGLYPLNTQTCTLTGISMVMSTYTSCTFQCPISKDYLIQLNRLNADTSIKLCGIDFN